MQKYSLKEDVWFEKCLDGVAFLVKKEGDSLPWRYSCPHIDRDLYFEPIPDTPKPLWELMPEIVKGRRFRHINTKSRVWRKISDCGNHFVDMDGASSPPIRSANFIETKYILEPIE